MFDVVLRDPGGGFNVSFASGGGGIDIPVYVGSDVNLRFVGLAPEDVYVGAL